MERKIFAIYDPDQEFVFRFMEFVKVRSHTGMDVLAFTGEEHLRETLEKTKAELLLVSSRVLTDQVRNLPAKTLVVLQEDPAAGVREANRVYKYQSPEELLRKCLEFCEREPAWGLDPGQKEGVELIGIYSPVGRTKKTSFALTLGQVLAESQPVLYLNLEMFAGFEQLLREKYERTLSDLLYFARQKPEELQNRLVTMVRRIRNLEYVPPVRCPDDLQSVKAGEWLELFGRLGKQTPYQVVILDLGEAVQGLTGILAACNRIYVPVRSDPMSQAKAEQFCLAMEEMQGTETAERIRKVKLPFFQSDKTGKEYFADLVRGEMGDLVRRELAGGVIGCRQN